MTLIDSYAYVRISPFKDRGMDETFSVCKDIVALIRVPEMK